MLKTYITNEDVIEFEPALDDYLRSTQTDFQDQIDKTFEILVQDLKSNGLKIKLLCTPLELQASAAKTTSFDGLGVEDEIERRFWILNVTANSGSCVFTLQGSNDNVTFTTITTQAITQTGSYANLITTIYDYYRVTFSGTSATYSSELIEESFFFTHLYLTLWNIYTSLQSQVGDMWESKAIKYWELYQTTLKSIKYSYDEDDSGSVGDEEGVKTYRPRFTR
jgi:hypothetical protein